MAKGSHALGGSFRGRIGTKTCYVRHGQQIIYERVPRVYSKREGRHYTPSKAMMLAWDWKNELKKYGVDANFEMLLRWVHATYRVADGGDNVVMVDGVNNLWSPTRVVVSEGTIATPILAQAAAGAREFKWKFGLPIPSTGLYASDYAASLMSNDYQDAAVFCSIVGYGDFEYDLNIGSVVHNARPVAPITLPISARSCVACYRAIRQGLEICRVPLPAGGTLPDRLSLVRCDDWTAPLVEGDGGLAAAWAVYAADGTVLDMAVFRLS